MSTVVAVPAERPVVRGSGWSRRRAPRAPSVRSWVRAEVVAFDALEEARESGDAGLVEEARRVWSSVRHRCGRRPAGARR